MKTVFRKILAIVEVSLVVFALIPLLTLGIYRLFPQFETWQTAQLGFPFPVFVYGVMVVVSFGMVVLRGKRWSEYALTFQDPKSHLDLAGSCFVPVALANIPFGLGVDPKSWGGALILAVVQVALLFVLARMIARKPSAGGLSILSVGAFGMAGAAHLEVNIVGKAVAVFLTYALFVGFGEEILYRGYMQSRLNEVFGKPYRFYGVAFGWGALITALLFGLTHVGVLRWILGLSNEVTLAWGFWTIFSGLVFGLIREKSGSILAPALLHGLPQAIAAAVMVFF
jgi:membrane protease YdiL (CAAX protease family)